MTYLIAIWFMVAGVTYRGIYYDLQEEKQTVRLFEQTEHGYRTYYVRVEK